MTDTRRHREGSQDRPEDLLAAEKLLAASRGRSPTPVDEDADAETVSAYAAGALNPEETAAFERRLADDDDLRETWAVATQSIPRRGASRAPAALWGIAALVLVAVGVFVATQRAKSESLDQQLIARLQTIDTQPLSADELTVGAAPVERNGLRLLTPRGILLERRPTLRWAHPTGGGTATIVVEDEQTGLLMLRATSESGVLAWPADRPALREGRRYLWRCEVAGPMGPLRGRALFETAGSLARRTFEAQVAKLGSDTAADLASVHLALRHNYWDEALRRTQTPATLRGAFAAHREALAKYARARLAGAKASNTKNN